jgi:two-component system response regulator CpxR
MEFDVLVLLMRAAGRIVSRGEMAATLHQREASPFERSLDVHISHLRKKLAPKGDQLLRTVRGVGYQLSAQE